MKYKIYILSAHVALFFIGFSNLAHAGNAFSDVKEFVEQNQGKKNVSLTEIEQLRKMIVDTSAGLQIKENSSSQVEYLNSILLAIQLVNLNRDPGFDFSKLPAANVLPPAGVMASSGADPKSITDPIKRQEYEAAIAANRAYAEVYEKQSKLNELYEKLLMQYSAVVKSGLDPSVASQIYEKINVFFPDDAGNRQVRDILIRRTSTPDASH